MTPLSREERDRFGAWLVQQAKSSESLADQTANMAAGTISNRLRLDALACRIVADKLASIESEIIESMAS